MIAISTIYIDVLFLVNFIINLTILNTEAIFLRLPIKLRRIITGAAVGAIYSCAVFIIDASFIASAAVKIVFAFLTVGLAFGKCKVIASVKRTAAFFALTVAMGFGILGVLYLTPMGIKLGGFVKNGIFYFDISLGFIVISCITAYAVSRFAEKSMQKSVSVNCTKITLCHCGKTVTLKALVDTGNFLKDPFSGRDVLIAEADALAGLFDFDITSISDNGFENLPPGFRLIPFSSVGNSNGVLAAFVPDKAEAEKGKSLCLTTALFEGSLSGSGDYNALIGPAANRGKYENVI